MIVTDTYGERYGAGAPPLADPWRCLNDATHGISAGECTQRLCPDHVEPALCVLSGNVLVYPLRAHGRCEYRPAFATA